MSYNYQVKELGLFHDFNSLPHLSLHSANLLCVPVILVNFVLVLVRQCWSSLSLHCPQAGSTNFSSVRLNE